MNKSGNIIVITGGSSGIGLELARELIEENTIIICGRDEKKLSAAKLQLPSLITYQLDLSVGEDIQKFTEWVSMNYARLNVLINNAALVHVTDFLQDKDMITKAQLEINTNLVAPILLIKQLLPVLLKNENATVVNVTTGLVFVPRVIYPIYCATKAALHSFTQVLRHQLNGAAVMVSEVMMPAVNTPWHKGNPPKIAIPVEQAVSEMITGLFQNKEEIMIGKVRLLYWLSRFLPKLAFRKINQLK